MAGYMGGPLGMKMARSTLNTILFGAKATSTQTSIMSRTICLSSQYDRSQRSSTALVVFDKSRAGINNLMDNKISLVQKRFSSGGDHVKLWTAEKAVSAAFLPILPLAFLYPSAPLDYLLAFTMVIHSHWGIEAIVVDYVRPVIFGETIPKIALGLLTGVSILTFGGLCYFIYTDVGLVNAVKLLWSL